MKWFNNISIAKKLPLILLTLMAITLVAMGTASFYSAQTQITQEAQNRLIAVAETKSREVEDFFARVDRDLSLRAQDPLVVEAIQNMSVAFANHADPTRELQRVYIEDNPHPIGKKDNLTIANSGHPYDALHARFHPYFNKVRQNFGYYDLFLFDTSGNLIYSVYKESDFATNMLDGPWSDSGLARAYNKAMRTNASGQTAIEDFAPYGPSSDAPASFIARPVFDTSGNRIGVISYQLPVDTINAKMDSGGTVGESGDIFLVGSDEFLRTDSPLTSDDDMLTLKYADASVQSALSGESALGSGVSTTGFDVLSAVHPVSFLGMTWALVVQQGIDEINIPIVSLRNNFILQGALIMLLMLVASLLVARSITLPLQSVGRSIDLISKEEYDNPVSSQDRADEIGDIARATAAVASSLKDASKLGREAAFKGRSFEVSGVPMSMTDLDFSVIYSNPAMERMLKEREEDFAYEIPGFTADGIVGKNMDDFHNVPQKARMSLADPNKLPFKLKIRVRDAYLGLLVDGVRDKNGALIGYVQEWKDQTLQMHTQVVLDAIDARQCRLEIGLDGTIKGYNDTFCKTFDTENDDFLGSDGREFIKNAEKIEVNDLFEILDNGKSHFDRFMMAVAGREKLIEGSMNPLPDNKGKTSGYLLIGVDVTEQRAQIEAARAQREEMSAAQAKVVDTLQIQLGLLSKGDLTGRINDKFDEENERLRTDFNNAMDELLSAMREVVENTQVIQSKAVEISSSTDNLSTRTEHQAATLEETASALDNLTSSVKTTADGASEAANIVVEARGKAEQSGAVVREAVDAMGEIENSSREISKIIGVIDDIAFQTNLLALNAGVEAARAGEAGRGFAVVASEVRALAQRSSEAAREISTLITSSESQVSRGVGLVGQAGESLNAIVQSVSNIADHVSHIASSAESQSIGLAEINEAVNQLDRVTQQNAAMVEEATAATHMLNQEAQGLANTVEVFNIGETKIARPVAQAEHKQIGFSSEQRKAVGQSTIPQPTAQAINEGGWEDF